MRHKGAKRERHDPVIEWEVPTDMGVIAGNLKKREIWQCLHCPRRGCNGCPLYDIEDVDWDEVKRGLRDGLD